VTISATIIGRLGKDPETRNVGSTSVTEFRVATRHGFGDRQVDTWLSVSLWGKRGETAARHLKKGDAAIFTGCSVYNEEYNGKLYLKAEASGFEFVPKSKDSGGQGGYQPQPPASGGGYGQDESIPF